MWEQCLKRYKELLLNVEDYSQISQDTIGQNCNYWLFERRKRITASHFGNICKMRTKTSRIPKVYEIVNGQEHDENTEAALVYGKIKEETSKVEYMNQTGEKVIDYGLFISPDYPILGCSLDGIIVDKITNTVIHR